MASNVSVVIASALKRIDWLLERSLNSVYLQERIDPRQVNVIIVDDNEPYPDPTKSSLEDLRQGVMEKRRALSLHEGFFPTTLLPNSRTKGHSGTGAWNTGIFRSFTIFPEGYISILDDDDEYMPYHLADCLEVIEKDPGILAVFQELSWKNPDGEIWSFPLKPEDISEEAFFIGNPGVQGSNMFIRTSSLVKINAFDESFTGTTDRDLMIRLISEMKRTDPCLKQSVRIIPKPGVIHYNHNHERVTMISERKKQSLDLFYKKYSSQFSGVALQQSLKRAAFLFDYHPDHA